MRLFHTKYGIIPACDVDSLDQLDDLIRETCNLEFIVGYKIGMQLAIANGVPSVSAVIRCYTSLPIIYDHQKFGTDIPDICGGKVLEVLKSAGVDALIIFPHSGTETLKATINGCKQRNIVAIVGGEMTHRGYLVKEGGYIADNAPERIYTDAANLGVEHFIIPGTKIDSMKKHKERLLKAIQLPSLLFPGIGTGQGGDICEAFLAARPCPSYAIVGRGIYAQSDKKAAATALWSAVRSRLPELVS